MDRQDLPRPGAVESAVGALVTLGFAEWLLRGVVTHGDPSLRAGVAGLLGVLALYGGVGLSAGLVALLVRGRHAAHAAGPAAAVAALALGLQVAEWGLHPLETPAAVALAVLLYLLAVRLLDRLETLSGRIPWLGLAAATLAGVLAQLLASSPGIEGRDRWLLVGAVAAALIAALLQLGRTWKGSTWTSLAWVSLALPIVGLALVARPAISWPHGAPVGGDRPSVVLITIDTLRADRVGAYGHSRARTPHLDDLARTGVRFDQAIAPAGITGPSHGTILTGRLPEELDMFTNMRRIPPEIDTLADVFRHDRYATGAFVGGWTTTDEATGLPSRFSHRDDDFRTFRLWPQRSYGLALFRLTARLLRARGEKFNRIRRNAVEVTEPVLDWLGRVEGRPFFIWVHYFDPHLPYEPTPDHLLSEKARAYEGPVDGRWYSLTAGRQGELVQSAADVEQMMELYDAEIAFVDEQVGRVLQAARTAAGGEANLITVITADHGESMGEHALWWKRHNYDPTLRVPLIVDAPSLAPDRRGAVIEPQVRLLDVAPTVLDLAGLEPIDDVSGRSLTGLMQGSESRSTGPAWSVRYVEATEFNRPVFSLRHDGWKLIRRPSGWQGLWWVEPTEELYRLVDDPRESVDLSRGEDGIPEELGTMFDGYRLLGRGVKVDRVLDEVDHEKLRSLGYVH